MTKRKSVPAKDSIRYIQTDISSYYKVRSKASTEAKTCTSDTKETSGVATSSFANDAPAIKSEPPSSDRFSNDEEASRSPLAIISLLSDDETDLATSEPNPSQEASQEIIRRIPAARPIPSDDKATLVGTSQESELIRRISACTRPISSDDDSIITNYNPTMNTDQKDSEKIVRRALPGARPLSSDDEISSQESTIILGTNDSLEVTLVVTPSAPKRKPSLPFKLPCYGTDSEDSDVTYCNGLSCTSLQNSASSAGRDRNVCQRTPVRRSRSVEDSTDDEEITPTPTKVTRIEATLTQEKVAAKFVPKRLFLSQQVQQTLARTDVSVSELPSTSKQLPVETTPTNRTANTPKPLQESNSESDSPSSNPEFVSTDFISPSGIQSVPKTTTNKHTNENINTTLSPSKITVIENIRIAKPSAMSTPRASLASAKLSKKVNKTSSVDNSGPDEWKPFALKFLKKIVTFICSHDHLKMLLTGHESEFLTRFFQADVAYIFVCLKLFMDVQKWHRLFDLGDKFELSMSGPELDVMHKYLTQNGFVDADYSSESCEYLLNHLHYKDIKKICSELEVTHDSNTKSDMIQSLIKPYKVYPSSQCVWKRSELKLRDAIQNQMGICIKLNSNFFNLLSKVHILYGFTNEFQDATDLYNLLTQMEKKDVFLPEVRIHGNFHFFESLDEFKHYTEAYQLKRCLSEAKKVNTSHISELCAEAYTELKQILESTQDREESSVKLHFTPGAKYAEILSEGLKLIARQYPEQIEPWLLLLLGQEKFIQQDRTVWYDLLVTVRCSYLNQVEAGVEVLIEALTNGRLSEMDKHELSERADSLKQGRNQKMSKMQKDQVTSVQPKLVNEFASTAIQVYKAHRDVTPKEKKSLKKSTEHEVDLQEEALGHYRKFPKGLICGNTVLTTLLSVLFWDIIYDSNIPGAFVTEIQYLPSDFYTKGFYMNRQNWIDRRLDEIRDSWPTAQLKQFACSVWEKHGHRKSLINNELNVDGEDLFDIVLCIGRVNVARILERLVKDFVTYQHGVPDLFFWNVSHKRCKFVQVRAQREKLSVKQRFWLNFLHSLKADVEECVVHVLEPKRTVEVPKIKSAKKEVKKCLSRSFSAKDFIL